MSVCVNVYVCMYMHAHVCICMYVCIHVVLACSGNLLYSRELIQCSGLTESGMMGRAGLCAFILLIHFIALQKLKQHGKATVSRLKKRETIISIANYSSMIIMTNSLI